MSRKKEGLMGVQVVGIVGEAWDPGPRSPKT